MSNGSLLLVEDDARLREALSNTLTNDGLNVSAVESAEAALTRMEVESYDLVLSDIQMSGMGGEALLDKVTQLYPEVPVVLMTAFASVPRAVDAIRHGAADYLQKPISRSDLLDCARRYTRSSQACNSEVVAQDSSMKQVLNLARRSAAADITVLLRGESGTGKEVLSRLIHECSGRTGDFVAINCAAIPENLLESELFGHEKGSFTGASMGRQGLFETALEEDEIITSVSFPVPVSASYQKFDQPASKFALTGVFAARFPDGVRVAVTGASEDGVFRWTEAEEALNKELNAEALMDLHIAPDNMISDLHGSKAYRANLVRVLTKRAVAELS